VRVAVLHNLVDGGARRRLAEQVAALDADVVEVTTPLAVPVTSRPYVVPLKVLAPGLPAALRPPQRWLDLNRLRATWRTMGDLAERAGADVIFANPDSVLRGAVPLGPRTTPVIRYCDEPRRIDYEPALRDSLNPRTRRLYAGLRALERSIDRAGIATADALATNSRYSARRISAAYGRTADVLPCGAPARMTADGAEPAHLLSVGRLIATKGHDLAIEAAGRSGLGLPVVVVGHYPDRAEEDRLHAVAARHGVPLEIRTGIADDELIALYRGAFALLYLATAEPLGLASLEAQACGTPAIVAAEGGLPETVLADRTGFVVARDAGAAADALVCLSRDGVRAEMSRAAASLLNGHSWARSAALLREMAERLTRHPDLEAAA